MIILTNTVNVYKYSGKKNVLIREFLTDEGVVESASGVKKPLDLEARGFFKFLFSDNDL